MNGLQSGLDDYGARCQNHLGGSSLRILVYRIRSALCFMKTRSPITLSTSREAIPVTLISLIIFMATPLYLKKRL